MRTLNIPRGVFNAVCYTADGEYLVGLHSGWRLRVWATADFTERYAGPLPGVRYSHGKVGLLGDLAILTLGVYDLAGLWDALRAERGRVGDPSLVRDVTLTPLEERMAYVSYTNRSGLVVRTNHNWRRRRLDLGFWDKARLVRSYSIPGVSHATPVFSPDGRLVVASAQRMATLHDGESGKHLARLDHSDLVTGAAFSPDGRTLAVSAGRSLWLWDVESREGRRHPAFDRYVDALAFSPDGQLLAVADRTGEIRLLAIPAGREVERLDFEVGAIHGLMFSPDGSTVAGAGRDNAVVVWDL